MAGLLAETGLTLREDEAAAIRMLAATDARRARRMLLSADQFCDLDASDLTVEMRRDLLARLGMFGVRAAVDAARHDGVTSAAALSQFLVEVSGLPRLRRLLAEQFTPRAAVLKARSCLVRIRALADAVASDDPALALWIRTALERIDVTSVEFARLRAAHLVTSGLVDVPAGDFDDLRAVLTAVDAAAALGLPGDASDDALKSAALPAIGRWRAVAGDPLQPPLVAEVYEAAARTCETIYVRA